MRMIDSLLDYLIYGLVLVGFLVFNYLNGRRAQREQRERPLPSPAGADSIEPDPYEWGRGPASEAVIVPWVPPPAQTDASPTVPAVASGSNDRAVRIRSQLRGTQGLRDAIVLMTVLGPCVANKDRNSRSASPPPTP